MRSLSALSVLVAVMLVGAPSHAQATSITYNNFGANDSYNTDAGSVVGGDPLGNNLARGFEFTPSTSGTLASIVIALEIADGFNGTNAATVTLRKDASGSPDGILESFALSNLPPFDGNFHTPVTLNDSLNIALTAGTPYWLVASSPTGSSEFIWNLNSIGARGNTAGSSDGGATWETLPNQAQSAFRVTQNDTGAPVPEPTSLLLLGTGLIGAAVRRRVNFPLFDN